MHTSRTLAQCHAGACTHAAPSCDVHHGCVGGFSQGRQLRSHCARKESPIINYRTVTFCYGASLEAKLHSMSRLVQVLGVCRQGMTIFEHILTSTYKQYMKDVISSETQTSLSYKFYLPGTSRKGPCHVLLQIAPR